jgi:hypothetical protein
MAPNMILLAFLPDLTGLPAETAAKPSRLHRQVARYLRRIG